MLDDYFACHERRGSIIRHVVEVTVSAALEKHLLSKLLEPDKSPVQQLKNLYLPGTRVFLVDDVGVLIKGVAILDLMCDVHVGFWDHVLFGREDMCRQLALRVAEDEGRPGVWTAIPESSRATLAFAKRIGFKELRQRKGIVLLALVT